MLTLMLMLLFEIFSDGLVSENIFVEVMALRWIKENIHNFGGDPNAITLFSGESSSSSYPSKLSLVMKVIIICFHLESAGSV